MNSWDLKTLRVASHSPEILSSASDGRAVVLEIPAGESLTDHQVHERAWIVVVDGDVEFNAADGQSASGGAGLMVEFEPGERHAVHARSASRLLLVLIPWPGEGHPGTMTLADKATVRQRAADHRNV